MQNHSFQHHLVSIHSKVYFILRWPHFFQISNFALTLLNNFKIRWEIFSSNFVAFLQYLNFNSSVLCRSKWGLRYILVPNFVAFSQYLNFDSSVLCGSKWGFTHIFFRPSTHFQQITVLRLVEICVEIRPTGLYTAILEYVSVKNRSSLL